MTKIEDEQDSCHPTILHVDSHALEPSNGVGASPFEVPDLTAAPSYFRGERVNG
jgi:hypothetical protein